MVAPPKRRAPHKAIHYRTRDKGVYRNGPKSGPGGREDEVDDDQDLRRAESQQSAKYNHQPLLDIFRNTFYEVLTSSDFTPKLQAVKQALFERDFAKAFGDPENLEIYAARWSPTRALCYASILWGIRDQLEAISTPLPSPADNAPESSSSSSSVDAPPPPPSSSSVDEPLASVDEPLASVDEPLASVNEPSSSSSAENPDPKTNVDDPPQQSQPSNLKKHLSILSIGGCAAELVSFGGLLAALPTARSGSIALVDSAPWGPVISSLTDALTSPPQISKYASAAAVKALGGPPRPFVDPPSRLTSAAFLEKDVLTLGPEGLSQIVGGINNNKNNSNNNNSSSSPMLVTLLFTLNELFTASGIGKTTKFLLDLTSTVPFGSLLLVVDSPGSYSETKIGKESKRYPMQWLLDRIILGTQKEPVAGRKWKKLESTDSAWFRLDSKELNYPIPLENMRYQMHLYKVLDAGLPDEGGSDDE